mmetsp:Transcript_8691/g.36219  ORF Transcript_8691/g.36219 Transcript_8691/m.36219 type:complete len:555 (+) Transcript_8691:3-1667(+)
MSVLRGRLSVCAVAALLLVVAGIADAGPVEGSTLQFLLVGGPSAVTSEPLVNLAKELIGRGHEVYLAYLEIVEEPLLELVSDVFDATARDVDRLHFIGAHLRDGAVLHWKWNDARSRPTIPVQELFLLEESVLGRLLPVFSPSAKAGLGLPAAPLDCVVADQQMWGACDVADAVGVPCIVNAAGPFQNPFRGSLSQPEFRYMVPYDLGNPFSKIMISLSNWMERLKWVYRSLGANYLRESYNIPSYPAPDRAFMFNRVTLVNAPIGVEPPKVAVVEQVRRTGSLVDYTRHPVSDALNDWLVQSDKPVLFISVSSHLDEDVPATVVDQIDSILAKNIGDVAPSNYRFLWNEFSSGRANLGNALASRDVFTVAATGSEEGHIIGDPRVSVLVTDGKLAPLVRAVESATPMLCVPCCREEYAFNCAQAHMAGSAVLPRFGANMTRSLFDDVSRLDLSDFVVHSQRAGGVKAAADHVILVTTVGERFFLPLDVQHLHWLFQQSYLDIAVAFFLMAVTAVWLCYASVTGAIRLVRYLWPIFLDALGDPLDAAPAKQKAE